MNYTQGSEWRKWDLHVHTPCSIYHNYPGTEEEAWAAFLADLEALPPEFKVIGINDYLFLDGYKRVLVEKSRGRLGNLDLILPVVELRLDKFVGHDSRFQRVHYHVIFDVLDPETIETQFINLLSRDFKLLPDHEALTGRWSAVPTRKSLADFGQTIIDAAPADRRAQYGLPLHVGFNNFNVTLETVQKALSGSYFKDRCLTAVGKAEWDQFQWSDGSIAEKRNVIHNADIVFTAAETIGAFHRGREALERANVNNRLLDCSDAHELSASTGKDRIGRCFTWIKADTTFAGLRHAIKEYRKRVFIGDIPEKVAKVRMSPTRYIKEIRIVKLPGSPLGEPWFNCSLPINEDLVAIIGNKGSGKSALTDTLGLLGNTRQNAYFSFLNDRKFRDPRNNKASHFEATLMWESGVSSRKKLDSDPEPNSVETIKYLPQNYIETLCNEIAAGGGGGFERELKQIIFSHVDPSERFGRESLDEVLRYLTTDTQATIRVLAERVHEVNQEIVGHEERSTESFRAQLESQLRMKRQELETHDRTKPAAVPEPAQSAELKEAAAAIRTQIQGKRDALKEIENDIARLSEEKVELLRKVTILHKVVTRLTNFRLQLDDFRRAITFDLQELGIEPAIRFEDVVQLTVDEAKLTGARKKLADQVSEIEKKLDPSRGDSVAARELAETVELQRLQDSLDEPNRKFVAYQSALEAWTRKRAAIQGDAKTPHTIAWLENQLRELEGIPVKLQELEQQREGWVREIYRATNGLAEAYRRLYSPVQEFVERQKISAQAIPLSFSVSIAEEGFATTFLEKINRQVKGTFSGLEESSSFVSSRLQTVDFDNEDSVIAFVNEMYSALHFDKRPGVPAGTRVKVSDQIRKGETPVTVYDYLYSLSFLTPRYALRYGGREIHQLAPGERGLLLLVFYLLIDKDDIPLVIDQPEENLDNQTIYEVLVQCLGEAKRRRQVVVVTHNPNLAVVCDAEQVIYAQRDTALNAITYEAGAIENPIMNKHVIDVLEGTRPAFENRDSKYFA